MDRNEIRARIKAKGMTLGAFAASIDLEQDKLSKSLAGKRQFSVGEMDAVRAALADDTLVPARQIPVIGLVAAGNWREAVQNPGARMPSPDPSLPPRAFGLKVSGDSMDLVVEDGATVIVDPDDKALFPNRYYIVTNGEGEATFKQFKPDPARLAPCSTNEAHRDILIGGDSFEVVGRVIWRASRM